VKQGADFQKQVDETLKEHPDYVYDEARAGRCIAAYVAAAKGCGRDATDEPEDTIDCEGMFRGKVAPGQPCSATRDCALSGNDRTTCFGLRGSGSKGTCVTMVVGKDGDRCYSADQAIPSNTSQIADCNKGGLWCNAETRTCAAKEGEGGDCAERAQSIDPTDTGDVDGGVSDEDAGVDPDGGPDEDAGDGGSDPGSTSTGSVTSYHPERCAEPTYCGKDGKCTAPKAVGDECQPNSSGACGGKLSCDAKTKKCVARKKAGESCGGGDGGSGSADLCEFGCDSVTEKCQANPLSRKACAGTEDLD
jgi:hypothetical protein